MVEASEWASRSSVANNTNELMLWVRLEPMTVCSLERVLYIPLSYDNMEYAREAQEGQSQLQIKYRAKKAKANPKLCAK